MDSKEAPVLKERPDGKFERIRKFFASKAGKLVCATFLILTLIWLLLFGPEDSSQRSASGRPTLRGEELNLSESATHSDLLDIAPYREGQPLATIKRGPSTSKFQQSEKISGPKVVRRVLDLDIPEGATVNAELITGASTGPVKARLSSELKGQFGDLLLPERTIILGKATAKGDRLHIDFLKAIFPDGDVAKLTAVALDGKDQSPGIKGSFLTREGLLLAGSITLNTLSGVAEGLEEYESVGGDAVRKNTLKNAALNGASRASLEQGRELTRSFRDSAKVVTVSAGTKILVFFEGVKDGGGF